MNIIEVYNETELTYEKDPTGGWQPEAAEFLLIADRGQDGQLQLLPKEIKYMIHHWDNSPADRLIVWQQ